MKITDTYTDANWADVIFATGRCFASHWMVIDIVTEGMGCHKEMKSILHEQLHGGVNVSQNYEMLHNFLINEYRNFSKN